MAQANRINSRLYTHITAHSPNSLRRLVHRPVLFLVKAQRIPPVMFGDTSSAGFRVSESPCKKAVSVRRLTL